jgi:flagellar biosynthesis protein FlhB
MTTEQDVDRNESATPHKLSEARGRAQIAKSPDIVSAAVLMSAVVYLNSQGWGSLVELFRFDRLLLGLSADGTGSAAAGWRLWDLVDHCIRGAMGILLPALATIVVVAIVANIAQTGPVFSSHPIQPDWQRINPQRGLRRVFSMRTLFDGARACVKLTVLVIVVGSSLRALVPQFQHLSGTTPLGHAHAIVADLASMGFKVALALSVLALLDFGYAHREFARNMRMSRREVRDEFRNREGDPRIRARLRGLRKEMLRRSQSLSRTAQADVLITNPTHIAVALRYEHGQMNAPVLVSKGAGGLAAAMRLIAARHRVPVVRSPSLARALHARTELDRQIPPELFADTARIMVWVLSMRAARAAGHAGKTIA